MTEADIIKGCRKGDERSCKALVQAYSGYVYTICRRYVKDEDVAKDCMQESLIQVIRKIDQYEERGKLKSWISAVTVKKCLDIMRKEKRHLSSDLDLVAEPCVDETITNELNAKDVMIFLDQLPDQYRIAINLFLVEGYSHKEIGEQLGVTESSSRSLVSRGRKMILESFRLENKRTENYIANQNSYKGFNTKIVSIK
ncbi:RNA polymerase sigma factor [Saprospiraceae bacterium]|nr:RNA polymerase sigma factor [Saprospiraceae bacterium]